MDISQISCLILLLNARVLVAVVREVEVLRGRVAALEHSTIQISIESC